MRPKLPVLVSLLLCCAAIAAAPAEAAMEDCVAATCRITAPDGGRGTGCVFEVGDGCAWILTCGHVVGQARAVECEFWRAGHLSRPLGGLVVAAVENAECDAAIVVVALEAFGQGERPRVVRVADPGRQLAEGEQVISVGCAKGGWATAWSGHVLGRDATEIYFTPPPLEGRSGSALFTGDGREIVGVIRARTPDDQVGIAVPIHQVYAAMGWPRIRDAARQASFRPGTYETATAAAAPNSAWRSSEVQCPGGSCPVPAQPGVTPQTYGSFLPYRSQIDQRIGSMDQRLGSLEGRTYPTLPQNGGASGGGVDAYAVDQLQRRLADVETAVNGLGQRASLLEDQQRRVSEVGERLATQFPEVETAIAAVRREAQQAASAASSIGVSAVDAARREAAAVEEKVERNLLERLGDRIRGIATQGLWGLGLGGSGLLMGGFAVLLALVRRDVRKRVETGNPLLIERLAGLTSNTVDDRIARGIAAGLAGVYGRVHGQEPAAVQPSTQSVVDLVTAVMNRIQPAAPPPPAA